MVGSLDGNEIVSARESHRPLRPAQAIVDSRPRFAGATTDTRGLVHEAEGRAPTERPVIGRARDATRGPRSATKSGTATFEFRNKSPSRYDAARSAEGTDCRPSDCERVVATVDVAGTEADASAAIIGVRSEIPAKPPTKLSEKPSPAHACDPRPAESIAINEASTVSELHRKFTESRMRHLCGEETRREDICDKNTAKPNRRAPSPAQPATTTATAEIASRQLIARDERKRSDITRG